MLRVDSARRGVFILAMGLIALPAQATIIHSLSGISSVGTPVSFRAELTISGDILTVSLFNDSTASSTAPNDLLSSYFFDIVNGAGVRPVLTYQAAHANVYLARQNAADVLQTSNANVKAVNAGDGTWEFRTLNPTIIPGMGFGIGTVGNANLAPNNFHGNVVDGLNYSIYAGEITTRNLDNALLVKGSATFTFSGLTGFSESDIKLTVAFGLGTAPDSLLVPEPATSAFLLLGGLLLCHRRQASQAPAAA